MEGTAVIVTPVDLAKRPQPSLHRGRDPLRNGRRELAKIRQSPDGLSPRTARQMCKHRRCLAWIQVPKHQRHRLRMLALEQPRQVLRIHLLQRLRSPCIQLVHPRQLVQHRLCPALAQRLHQQAVCRLASTFGHEVPRHRHLLKLLQHLLRNVRWYTAKMRDLPGHALQITLRQVAKDRRCRFIIEHRQKDRRLLRSRELAVLHGGAHA